MTIRLDDETRAEVLAELAVVRDRLARARSTVDAFDDEIVRDEFAERIERLLRRADRLEHAAAGDATAWEALHVVVDDLPGAVDLLELELLEAKAEPHDLRAVVERQLRAWRGRVEHLNVQATLGAMDARDDFGGLAQRVRHLRGAVVAGGRGVGDGAVHLAADLRDDVRSLVKEVTHAVEEAVDAALGREG